MLKTNAACRTLLLAATALALSGCANGQNPFKDFKWPNFNKSAQANRQQLVSAQADCPRVAALPELARISQFSDETNPVESEILNTTVLTKLDSSCITTETHVNLDIVLNFTSTLGTAGLRQAGPHSSYSHAYFVAVVNPDGSILAKDVFALSPAFSSGQKEVFSSERLQQTIPLSSKIPASQYQVMVGFQLSEDELAYNRRLKAVQQASQPLPETTVKEPPGLVIKPLATNRGRKPLN